MPPESPDELLARFDEAAAEAMALDEEARRRLDALVGSVRFGFELGRESSVPWEELEAKIRSVGEEHRRRWMSAVFD